MTVNVEKPTRRRALATGPKARKQIAQDPIADIGLEPERDVAPSPAPAALYNPPSMLMPSAPRATPVFVPRMVPGESMTIGEIDQTVFDCPTCSRPLALGARRCPGCSARLLNGVVVSKATRFVAAGLAIGLVVGTGAGFLLGLGQAAAAPLTVDGSAPPASAAASGASGGAATPQPTATPAPTAPPSIGTGPDAISPAARAALIQTIGTNDRLATAREELTAALGTARVDAAEIARILRGLSADAVHGEQLATRLAGWSGSATVATEVATFYDTIHDSAVDSLVWSVRNTAAYRSAATSMVRLLAGIPTVNEAIRSVAAAAGVNVPESAAPGGSSAP